MTFDLNLILLQRDLLLNGLMVTLELSVIVIALGTVIGLAVAFGKRAKNSPIRKACSIYTDFFRLMPALILLIWVFYALPIATGISLGAFETGVLVLSLHLSAYVGELIRSGVEAIPKGQIEAAKVLGLSDFQITCAVVLPQVFRQLLSPLTGLYIEEAKNTTLVAVIALNELLHTGQIIISQTYQPLEIYTAIAIMFVVILAPLVIISKKFEYAAFVSGIERNPG